MDGTFGRWEREREKPDPEGETAGADEAPKKGPLDPKMEEAIRFWTGQPEGQYFIEETKKFDNPKRKKPDSPAE